MLGKTGILLMLGALAGCTTGGQTSPTEPEVPVGPPRNVESGAIVEGVITPAPNLDVATAWTLYHAFASDCRGALIDRVEITPDLRSTKEGTRFRVIIKASNAPAFDLCLEVTVGYSLRPQGTPSRQTVRTQVVRLVPGGASGSHAVQQFDIGLP